MRVGIITFHCSYNFGSALQAFAIQHAIAEMGHEAAIIDYRSSNYYENYKIFNLEHPRATLRRVPHIRSYVKRERSFEEFFRHAYRMTPHTYTYLHEERLNGLAEEFDCFVCGSDQIWNLDATRGVVEPYFLSFAGDRRRVAYAPSLAHTSFRPEHFDKTKVSSLLAKFDAISVRESETVSLFQPLVDMKIEVAVDPTMLLDVKSYTPMLKTMLVDGKYVFVYLLRDCPELVQSAEAIAKHDGAHVVYVSSRDLPIPGGTNLFGIGPEEFVSLIAHAHAVLTNSFHATVFSLKFHVPFRVFAKDPSSSRMRDLLGELGLTACLSESADASIPEGIDWKSADAKAAELREGSLRFLREALS